VEYPTGAEWVVREKGPLFWRIKEGGDRLEGSFTTGSRHWGKPQRFMSRQCDKGSWWPPKGKLLSAEGELIWGQKGGEGFADGGDHSSPCDKKSDHGENN